MRHRIKGWLLSGCCIAAMCISCTLPPTLTSTSLQNHARELSGKWSEEPVVILNDTTTLELICGKKGNTLVQTSTTVYRINKQSPDLLQPLIVRYNTAYERPTEVYCKALYPDGTTWSVSGAYVPHYPVPTPYGYTSNQFFKEVTLPKYSAGMFLQVIEKRVYFKPEFFSFEMVGKSMPIGRRCIVFSAPAGSEINTLFVNGEHVPVRIDTVIDGGKRRISYAMENCAKIEDAGRYPRPGEWFAALHVSLPPKGTRSYSWRELGDYYLSQIKDAYSGVEGLSSYAPALKAGDTPMGVAGSVLSFVREKVRYHGDFEGVHAFIPHTISSIIANGYGDCKDMAILSQSLANRCGISFGLVLLNVGDGFEANGAVPTLGVFNHVVVAATLSDSTLLIMDPTVTHGNPVETGFYHVGKKALFLLDDRSRCDTVPRPPSFYNTVTSHSKLSYNTTEKRWELSGDIALCGLTAMNIYPDLSDLTPQEQAPVLRTYLKNYFELDAHYAAFTQLTSDTIIMHYTTSFQENYVALLKGGFLLNKPSLYGGDVRFTTLSYDGPRYYRYLQQDDLWSVPGRFSDLEHVNLTTDIATGQWMVRNQEVRRSFTQNDIRVESSEGSTMVKKKNMFLNARLWKQ